jgi:hypothetical protein
MRRAIDEPINPIPINAIRSNITADVLLGILAAHKFFKCINSNFHFVASPN